MTSAVLPDLQVDVDLPVLTDTVRAGILNIFRKVMGEDRAARRSEVRTAWKQRAFANGIQHLYYSSTNYAFSTPEASGEALPLYMDVYNIYTPHKRSFVSVLSQNPPGINFVPNDLQQSNDVTAASYAEKMRHRVDRLVHMKDRQAEAAGYFCTDGRTMAWVRTDEQGKLRVTMHGVLESKVPIYVRKMERWSYAVLSEEIDKHEAQATYPDYADKIDSETSSTADATFEVYARLNVIGGKRGNSADALKSVVTEHTMWLRPSRYRPGVVDGNEDASEETREYLQQVGPGGVRVTICGKEVVNVVPEAMDDALRVQWPAPGQGQNRPSMLHDLVPLQEAFNDYKNNLRDAAGYINPATWVDESAVDPEALPEQRSEPGAIHIINPPAGKAIADCVWQEQSAGLPQELIAACDQLLALAEFTSGDLPSLQGEGDAHSETASGQKMLSDQAKGQLSTAWAGIQWLFAGIYEIAVRLEAKNSNGAPVAIQGGNGQDSFNPAAILDGQFGCYPDTDSSFPETMADKRASLQMVLTQIGSADPSIALHPDNLKLVMQYSGLSDLTIPAAEARDKQLREIDQLLQEPPVPDESQMPQYLQTAQQAAMQGQQPPPPPMTASVPIDEVWDFHQPELDKLQEWLSSDARFEEERKGNLQGIQNVKLHGMAHKAALAKIAAANQPQQVPMTISGAFKDLDPATKVQVLQRDGYTPDGSAYEAANVQEAQASAADTAHTAAQAQHQSVLAAREQVAPMKNPNGPPEAEKAQ